VGGGPDAIVIGDLNGDTLPDVAVANIYTNDVSVLLNITPPCHALTTTHIGLGDDPTAVPANSPGCPAGSFQAGDVVQLVAAPAPGSPVSGWWGTDDDTSSATIDFVTMPAADLTVTVRYDVLTCGGIADGADPSAVASAATRVAAMLGTIALLRSRRSA